jgi:hypothetical protein
MIETVLLSLVLSGPADRVPLPPMRKPLPRIAVRKPLPPPAFQVRIVEPERVHSAKPTVRPMRIAHTYRGTGCRVSCMMCLGQHLRNYHGSTSVQLNGMGYARWIKYHGSLHDTQPQPKRKPGCEDGNCGGGGYTGGGRGFFRGLGFF